jgi:hypothetical protein
MAIHSIRCMLVMSTMAWCGTQAAAQGPSLEALERAFWRCDHAATRGLLDAGTTMECSVATEAFKARRFGGDFAALLAWWRANKDAQHLALSAATNRQARTSSR